MTISKSLLLLLVGGGLSYASSLAVYKDNTFYTYNPQNNFIGFAQNIRATCEGNPLSVSQMSTCPTEERLCKSLTALKYLEEKEEVTSANIKVLEQLLTLPQPNMIDANTLIEAARLSGEEEARLSSLQRKLKNDIMIQENDFRKQAPSKEALHVTENCQDEVEITIPSGIHFSTRYEANISDDKEIEVTQYLSVLNSSGIDISADTANFYYRMANQYVYPIHFNPWIVSKYVPRSNDRMYTKTMAKAAPAPAMEMSMMAEGQIRHDAPVASYEDAREYKIKNLTLPSTGVPLDVKLVSYKAALSCKIRAYPYANTIAFHVCSFAPKYQIDANQWKIKSSDIILNENAVGEYRDKSYNLYTKIEEDIQIVRKPIVNKERETGIFGGTERKKDGYNIIMTNKSDKAKTLILTERIPTSTTDEISSKLLSVKSEKNINYKVLRDGKIEMKIALAPNENKKIEVIFELSYDKDLKVNY